jgi:hypothetical protein
VKNPGRALHHKSRKPSSSSSSSSFFFFLFVCLFVLFCHQQSIHNTSEAKMSPEQGFGNLFTFLNLANFLWFTLFCG